MPFSALPWEQSDSLYSLNTCLLRKAPSPKAYFEFCQDSNQPTPFTCMNLYLLSRRRGPKDFLPIRASKRPGVPGQRIFSVAEVGHRLCDLVLD